MLVRSKLRLATPLARSQRRMEPILPSLAVSYHMVKTPADWKARAPRPLPNTTTFAHQDALPRLPVPDFESTLTKLEKSLKPLAHNPQELDIARSKIQALGAQGGFGRTLHERLLAHANDPDRVNWLEEFWDDVRSSCNAPTLSQLTSSPL